MRNQRAYLLFRRLGNRVPVMRHLPNYRNLSSVEILDMLPKDTTGRHAVVFGTSWDNAWECNVKNVKTICIDVGTVWDNSK